jgi:hypothetical protein
MNPNHAAALAAGAIVLAVVFRRKLRLWLARHGFRRTGASAGSAFLAAQSFLQPRIEHVLRVQQEEKTERADAGDLPDSKIARHLPRKPS